MRRRRLFSLEALEPRKLLTSAFISEIMQHRIFGDDSKEQYIELRGEPGAALPNGSYLVAVDSAKSFSSGVIKNIFDLSNQTFGNNGFMVLLQAGSPYSVSFGANVLQSTSSGFGGLPGGIYSDSNSLNDYLMLWQATFFLIQTNTQPQLGDDIDTNGDGFIDAAGIAANWNIFDSITVMNSLGDGNAYGKIAIVDTNLSQIPQVTAPAGTVVVRPNGYGYVGRIGNSTGWSAADWVGGAIEDQSGDQYGYRFTAGTFGSPAPIYMNGRELDNVGKENFASMVRYQLYSDANDNGSWDSGEPPVSGVKLLAEIDGNNTRNLLETVIEPDDFVDNRELDNLTPGVTLSSADVNNVIVGFPIQSVTDTHYSTGFKVLAASGIPWFNSGGRLRADFYNPAQSVTVDFIGDGSSLSYGRLEAFDSTGKSLQMVRTGGLQKNQVQQLTLALTTDKIAYVVAYGDDNYLSSSSFTRIDRFAFSVPEPGATSDADGVATFTYVPDGSYHARPDQTTTGNYLMSLPSFAVGTNENLTVQVPLATNVAPAFDPVSLSIPENSAAGVSAGVIKTTDRPGQTATYSLVGTSTVFSINASTGNIQLKTGAKLDFETQKSYTLKIRATDNAPKPLSADQDFVINVVDLNEAPTLNDKQFTIAENPLAGAVIGTITGTDVDAGINGKLSYRIVNALPENPVAIDEQTGQLTVLNPDYFDYDTRTKFTVTVETFDGGTPALAKRAIATINLTNVNEPHTIETTDLSVGELAAVGASVGSIQVSDPDAGQLYSYSWTVGFVTLEFNIDPNTGLITVRDPSNFNFALRPVREVEVTVTDRATQPLSTTKTITIHITDENNPPTLDNVSLAVDENSPADTEVGTITATDLDVGQTTTFALLGGTDRFVIDSSTGILKVKSGAVLNFEAQSSHQIIVQATDDGTPAKSAVRTLTVTVRDVNESPSVTDANLSVIETAAAGSSIGQVRFGDPDLADKPTIKIVGGDGASLFTIDSATGTVRVAAGAKYDFESSVKSYTLNVEVTDGVNAPVSGKATIAVTNGNDAPTSNGNLGPVDVLAGFPLSFVVPANAASDQDVGQTISYTVTGLAGAALPSWLTFNASTRTLGGTPWNPHAGVYNLQVVASDNGTPKQSVSIPLQVRVNLNATPWKNPSNSLDVSGNGTITPSDALLIINQLNSTGSILVPQDLLSRPSFLDVNGDNRVSASDALAIINYLNAHSGGEGEQADLPQFVVESNVNQSLAVDYALLDLLNTPEKRLRNRA